MKVINVTRTGHNIPLELLSLENLDHIRVCYDAQNMPFSYHAMSDHNTEIGFIILDMGIYTPIERRWGVDAILDSDQVIRIKNY